MTSPALSSASFSAEVSGTALTTPATQTTQTGLQTQLTLQLFPLINQPFTIRLDRGNYLIWKNQLLNVIMANGLDQYIDGSCVCPPQFLDNQQTQPNPAYSTWHKYNCLLMSWIYASSTEELTTEIVSYNTVVEIWEALAQIYSSATLAQLTNLRTELQSLKKEGMSDAAYINKLKSLWNSLAAIGEPVSIYDHLICMFNGLDQEYNAFVTSINNRPDRPSVEEVHSLFLVYESRLKRQHTPTPFFATNFQANLAHAYSSQSKPQYRLNTQQNHFQRPSVPSYANNSQFRPQGPSSILGRLMGQPIGNQWRPRGPPPGTGNSNRPACQICGLKNHVASDCYHRMNLSYRPPQPKAYNIVVHHSGDIGNFSGGNQAFQ